MRVFCNDHPSPTTWLVAQMATRACPPLANLPRLAVEKLAYSGYKVEAGDSLSAVGEQWKALTGDVRNAWPPSREKVVVDVPAGFAEKAVRTVAGCFRGTVPTYEQSFVFADYVQLWYHLGTAAKPASRAQVAGITFRIKLVAKRRDSLLSLRLRSCTQHS